MDMSMIKKQRREMEADIVNSIKKFEFNTGLCVKEVGVKLMLTESGGHPDHNIISDVILKY